jgi:hypothetical protein
MSHLWAEETAGNRMIRITADSGGAAVFNSYQEAAGIGAIKGTDGTVGAFGHSHSRVILIAGITSLRLARNQITSDTTFFT